MKQGLKLVAIIFFVSNALWAQDGEVMVLPFKVAVKMALEKNVTLNTQKNQLAANQAQRLQSYANYLPSITANGNLGKYSGQGQDPSNGDFVDLKYDFANANVGANLIIFNGFNRINNLMRFENQFMAQTSLINRAQQDAIFNVTNQYLQVLLDQEMLRIAEENFAAQGKTLEQIKGFVEVGSRASTDLYNANALYKSTELSMIRARVTYQNDKALLAQILQADPSRDFQVMAPEWTVDEKFINENSLEKLYEIAFANRADWKQSNYQIKSNKYFMRASTSGYMPTVSAFGQYGSQYASLFQGSFNEQFMKKNLNLQYGLQVSIPIFDRLVTRTNRVVAKVTLDNSELTRDNLEKTIKIDVQRAYKNYQAAIESFAASMAQFDAADLNLKMQTESYSLGVANQVTLALANQTYVQASAAKAQAQVTLIFQKILLEYALGILNPNELMN